MKTQTVTVKDIVLDFTSSPVVIFETDFSTSRDSSEEITLCSWDEIRRKDIRIGDKVAITVDNETPKIIKVLPHLRDGSEIEVFRLAS